ncbi:NAD(P)H-binding protein [Pedobacter sp. PWIIR3]
MTGSLGNISKPLTEILISQGHVVIVISSDPEKQQAIESLGAIPEIGSISDVQFLTDTFKEADAVYATIPLSFTEPDLGECLHRIASNYAQALKDACTKRVVLLSGWAADLVKAENVEHLLGGLDAAVTIMRPAAFYTNFYQSMDLIKGKGFIGKFLTFRYSGIWCLITGKIGLMMGNYGGEDRIVFVSPKDIAETIAEELVLSPLDKTIRYVGSEEMTCNEAANIIGAAIGKPWLKWILLSDEQMLQGLKIAKLPEKLAETLMEMQAAMHSGKTLENFHQNQPRMGEVKLVDFAKEFAAVYHKN